MEPTWLFVDGYKKGETKVRKIAAYHGTHPTEFLSKPSLRAPTGTPPNEQNMAEEDDEDDEQDPYHVMSKDDKEFERRVLHFDSSFKAVVAKTMSSLNGFLKPFHTGPIPTLRLLGCTSVLHAD